MGRPDSDGAPAIFHEGMIQGFRTWLCTLPERKLTLSYVVNCDAGDDRFYARMRRFRSELATLASPPRHGPGSGRGG